MERGKPMTWLGGASIWDAMMENGDKLINPSPYFPCKAKGAANCALKLTLLFARKGEIPASRSFEIRIAELNVAIAVAGVAGSYDEIPDKHRIVFVRRG